MDAKQFLAEFDHIANAAGGVSRLRDMIHSFAITGKLFSIDQTKEVLGSSLKEKAAKELTEYKAKHKYKKQRINTENILPNYEALPHWESVKLGDIGVLIRGVTYSKSVARDVQREGYIGLLRGNNISREMNYLNPIFVPKKLIKDEQVLHKDDILIAMSSGSKDLVGKAARLKDDTCFSFGAFCGAYRSMPSVNSSYIKILMQSPQYRSHTIEQGKGIGINNLTKGHIEGFAFYLPTLLEQIRIVAKVDELLALCDTLESQQQQKTQLKDQLRIAILQDVSNASSSFEIKQKWQYLHDNFNKLFSSADDTLDFSAHIKELAVKGLLSDSFSELANLAQARNERIKLAQEYIDKKLMRKQKTTSIAESNIVYPSNWQVVAFDEIAIVIGGLTKGRKLKDRELINCPYLAVANVQRGFFKLSNLKTIDIPVDELEKYVVKKGDLLITEGGDWDKVGRTAIWNSDISNCLHQNHVFKVRVPSDNILNEWVELVFNSVIGRNYFAGASKQTTNLASINMTQLRSFPFPIPPINEQRDILHIVKSMDSLCLAWSAKYEQLDKLSFLLAKEAVASLTGIAIVKKETPLKTPKTEIIAPISLGQNKPSSKDNAPLAKTLARKSGSMNSTDLWQHFSGDIDAFYAQLKTEVAHGWIAEPLKAEMLEKDQ